MIDIDSHFSQPTKHDNKIKRQFCTVTSYYKAKLKIEVGSILGFLDVINKKNTRSESIIARSNC